MCEGMLHIILYFGKFKLQIYCKFRKDKVFQKINFSIKNLKSKDYGEVLRCNPATLGIWSLI